MAELTGPVIVTNYGEQQLLAGTFDITKIKLGSGIWSPTMASTSLNTEEASVPASGTVEPEASGYRLRLAAVDDNDGNVYTLQEFALTDDTDQALAIYSQASPIATKTAGVDLLFSIVWLIDDTAGPITVTGATTYTLPLASESSAGLIEIATQAEANALADNTKALTPGRVPLGTTLLRGAVQLSPDAETIVGTDATKGVTPRGLTARMEADGLRPRAVGRIQTGNPPTIQYSAGNTIFGMQYDFDELQIIFDEAVAADADSAVVLITGERTADVISMFGTLDNTLLLRIRAFDHLDNSLDLETFVHRINYVIYGTPP